VDDAEIRIVTIKRIARFLPFAACIFLAACGTTHNASVTPTSEDEAFRLAMEDYIHFRSGPRSSRYDTIRIDLDGDGHNDGIALMATPYLSWCNDEGCHMIIMHAENGGFTLAGDIAPVRGPLIVSENRTNGWRDIVMHVQGHMDADAQDIALRYDGKSYAPLGSVSMADAKGVKIFP
jgi:hypothetical protein